MNNDYQEYDYYDVNFYIIATFNIGKPCDYKNLIIRNGLKSDADSEIQQLYKKIQPGYDRDLRLFNENPSENKCYKDNPKNFATQDELNIITAKRDACLTKIYKIMAEKCDIVMLQEVTNLNQLQLIKNIFGDSFGWFLESQKDNKSCVLDAIVGWRTSVFTPVKCVKGVHPNIKMANAVLYDHSKRLIIQVASLHAKGFSLEKPTEDEVKLGDDLILEASKEIPFIKSDAVFIGGDFNSEYAAPHHTNEGNLNLTQNRFKILENNGFVHVPQSASTCYNEELNKTTDLDHLFLNRKMQHLEVEVLSGSEYDFPLENPAKNCSDHKPLFFEATICSKIVEKKLNKNASS